jgi:hypothetical protein
VKTDLVQFLSAAMEETYQDLNNRLKGLTDAEFFWEPIPGCWTVHQDEQGHWMEDYEQPAPEPAPFTTLGWRLVHVATCKIMYYEYAFGERVLTWDTIDIPHTADGAISLLEEGHRRLMDALVKLSDADMTKMVYTNWGEQWPIQKIFWVMISHDLHHGGEIACLRDLYTMANRT